MRVFVAGATGVIARHAIPRLVAAGHDVYGGARTSIGAALVKRMGASPVSMDANDPAEVERVVKEASPDTVVNMLTALTQQPSFRKLDATMRPTNLLRTAGTDALVTATLQSGAARYVGQSVAGWFSEPPTGTGVADLLGDPPATARDTVGALRHLEAAVTSLPGGIVLRFGPLYGQGTSMGRGGDVITAVAKRQIPLVGSGAGVWSFCHIEDAGRAVALAVDHDATGVVEIVDDEPARVDEWLPALAQAIDAPAPKRAPTWLAKAAIGGFGVHLMTATPGATNRDARDRLGYTPTHRTWSEGFISALGR